MKLLTAKEVATMIGCSEKTIYSWVETGLNGIPYSKLGVGRKSPVRFDLGEIESWIKSWRNDNQESAVCSSGYNKITETVARPKKGDE